MSSRRSDLRRYFERNDGRMIHKWMHYFPIYERHLAPYRGKRVTMLEIGVSHGGSLEMWRHYLGRRAHIVGIDIDPRVTTLGGRQISVYAGDQSDSTFLDEIVRRHGPFDIVLDDGSHLSRHQIASIEHLWPHVVDGGMYIVEDVHSNYWPDYEGGGRQAPGTFVEWTSRRIDDMHAWHSRESDFVPNDWTRSIDGVHVYDSVVVFDKAARTAPSHRMTGRPSYPDIYGIPADERITPEHRAQLASLNAPLARLRRLARHPLSTLRRRW